MTKWLSRKLFAAVGSVLLVVLTNVGLPEDVAAKITDALIYIAGAYLIGQGATDAAEKLRKG